MGSVCRVWLHVGFRVTVDEFEEAFTEELDEIVEYRPQWDPDSGRELPKKRVVVTPKCRSNYRMMPGVEEFDNEWEFAEDLEAKAECGVVVTDEFVFIAPKFAVEEDDGQHYSTEGGGIADFGVVVALGPEIARIKEFFGALGLDVGKPLVGIGTRVS